jgi:hypothetical protein
MLPISTVAGELGVGIAAVVHRQDVEPLLKNVMENYMEQYGTFSPPFHLIFPSSSRFRMEQYGARFPHFFS